MGLSNSSRPLPVAHRGIPSSAVGKVLTIHAAAGVTDTPELVAADAGYWHLEQINEITAAA